MKLNEIETALETAGIREDRSRRKRVNCCGTNIYIDGGGVVCVYDNGTVFLQGNSTQDVCDWYEREIKPRNPKIAPKRPAPNVEDFGDVIVPSVQGDCGFFDESVMPAELEWPIEEAQSHCEPVGTVSATSTEATADFSQATNRRIFSEINRPLNSDPNDDQW